MSHFGYAMGARIVARSKRPGDDEIENQRGRRRRRRPLAWLRRVASWRPVGTGRHAGSEIQPETAGQPPTKPQSALPTPRPSRLQAN